MEDWSSMHQSIFDLIISYLFAKDQHTFSFVCRSWHEALLASPFRHSTCLIYNQKSSRLWRFSNHNTFFNKRFPKILHNCVIRFSNHGWLLMMSRDNNTMFFFDPFNNRTIQLPNLTKNFSFTTICFFHLPTSPECFIVGIECISDDPRCLVGIGLLRLGESVWNDYGYWSKEFQVSLAPPVLNQGMLYFVDVRGNVATLDIIQHGKYGAWSVNNRCLRQRQLRKCRRINEHFLIKPKGDDAIFAVFGIGDQEENVKVFKLLVGQVISWEPVHDLGEKVFYVSNTSSSGYTTSDKNMANKIFFPKLHGDELVYYSLDTGKYHSIDDTYSSRDSYGLRRLDFATWTTPTQQVNSGDEKNKWITLQHSFFV